MRPLLCLVLLVICSALVGCDSIAGESSYPSVAAATPIGTLRAVRPAPSPVSQSLTPSSTDIAVSVGPGTPAGAATPALPPSVTSGTASSGCDAWRVDQPIALPSPFAPNFPVPANTKWYKMSTLRNDTHTQQQIIGIAPLSLNESTKFLLTELPKAGYEITSTDSESNEADGLYKGNGWIGSYRVSRLDNCDTSTMWSIQVLKL